jgi:predicted dienelactone hydrolase
MTLHSALTLHMNSRFLALSYLVSSLAAVGTGSAPLADQSAEAPPSRPGIDAPELAGPGRYAVGVRKLALVDRNAVDVFAFDPAKGLPPRHDRTLTIDLWYPAIGASSARPEIYRDALPGENGKPVAFEIQGIAVRGARPAPGRYPLVVLSHGHGNVTVAMSWLTENLASKGYVVAAIRHQDAYTNPSSLPEALLRRPLDIAFVARSLQGSLASEGLIDPARTALIGYSMGGYGVLTVAGAELDPMGRACAVVPGDSLAPYAHNGERESELRVANLRAVVAISPFGGSLGAWGATGMLGIQAPLLLIAGDHDRTVDYASGARAFFDKAVNARRYLLTYRGGGHALGLGPAPPQMKHRLWDLDWFEDPVWRKERIVAVNLHLITAFLDRNVKGDETRAAYLDGLVPDSSSGEWKPAPGALWDAISPGTGDISVWKGFQRKHAEGLELLHAEPRDATARPAR